jgi:molecular chaperone GrpE
MAADKDKKKRSDRPHEPEPRDESTHNGPDADSTEPVVRDKRRIDPETGEARPQPVADDDSEHLTEEDLARLLDADNSGAASDAATEHLNDLKRVQAEYANYRKRVDRDRYVARDLAVAEVITSVLPVLDDLDLARAHGDLEGTPLELVAQKVRTIFRRYGLEQLGEVGEVFDPKIHEAIAQVPSKDATEETVADVVQAGYKLGERLLRPAKVAVNVPEG